MIIHTMTQYSQEWWDIRVGLPTASTADKILTPTGKASAQSRGFMCQLIADKLGFAEEPMKPTIWMQLGTAMEPDARRCFGFYTDLDAVEVGFITNNDATAGCSPDGLIYENDVPVAGLELKVVMAKTQIGYLLNDTLPAAYRPQVHWSMAVTGLDKWYFVSYFPGMEPLIVPVCADDYTKSVALAITNFTEKLAESSARFGLTERMAA